MAAVDVPPYHELLWPALQAVGELGGSASIGEIVETVIKREGFTDAQQAVLHNDGPETEIGYRLAWARTYLKGMGLLTNSSRGVWALTDDGTALLTDPSATDDQRSERIQEPQQPRAHPAGQARFRGQFPQQSGPGMRHHAPPVRADLDPALPATTLHPRSAFLSEGHRSFASSIFLCRQGTSSHLRPVSAYRRQTPRLAGRREVEDAAADAAEVDDPVWLHDERARSLGVQARNRDLPPAHTVVVTAVHAELPPIVKIIISGVDTALSRRMGGHDVGALGRGPAGRPRPCVAPVGRDVDPSAGVCFDCANSRLWLFGSMASEWVSAPGPPWPDAHVEPPSVVRTIPSYAVPTQTRDAFEGSITRQNAITSPGRASRCQVDPLSAER